MHNMADLPESWGKVADEYGIGSDFSYTNNVGAELTMPEGGFSFEQDRQIDSKLLAPRSLLSAEGLIQFSVAALPLWPRNARSQLVIDSPCLSGGLVLQADDYICHIHNYMHTRNDINIIHEIRIIEKHDKLYSNYIYPIKDDISSFLTLVVKISDKSIDYSYSTQEHRPKLLRSLNYKIKNMKIGISGLHNMRLKCKVRYRDFHIKKF